MYSMERGECQVKILERVEKLEVFISAIKTDIKWIKNAVLGIYGVVGLAVLSAIAEAIFRK